MRQFVILLGLMAIGCAGNDDEKREKSPFLDADQDGFPETTDCNDKDPSIHPDSLEMCDGIDNNCNAEIDEDTAFDAPLWYEDKDGDGFGDPLVTAPGCEPPLGFVGIQTDCDDTDGSAFPAAIEMCDTVDNDCDGTIDEGTAYDAGTWYRDQDLDGFGSFFDQIRSCEQPEGYVCVTDVSVDPCSDNCDNDLDGLTDLDDPDCTGFQLEYWADYSTEDWVNTEVRYWDYNSDGSEDFDCNDTNDAFSPGVEEQCDDNGMDENCDGLIDDEDEDAVGRVPWNADVDNDGYGDPATTMEACDQPGGMVANDGDCNDGEPLVNPDNAEVCGDGIDNDCDGGIDEEDAPFPLQWYRDADGDGYGDAGSTFGDEACAGPPGYVADGTDCHDGDSSIHPGATETWYDGTDDNCDGNDDDEDGDGYVGEGGGGDDCDDTDPLSSPGSPELCSDGADNNCDGLDEECEVVDAIVGMGGYDRTGGSVSITGDVDDDGKADAFVGASRYDGDGLSRGAGYLFSGDVTGEVSADTATATLVGESDHDRAGASVSIVGDTNGDGYDDLLIGAFAEDAGGSQAGAAYLVFGPVTGTINLADANAKLIGEVGEDHAGLVVAGAGDANGDGFGDFYVSAPGYDGSFSDVGATYLMHGPVDSDSDLSFANVRYVGVGNGEESGASVANAGDFNGDGFDDALIGAPNATEGGAYVGAVYLVTNDDSFEGSMDLDEAEIRWHGINGGDQVGYSVSTAGDQNGDGLDDIIIGAPGSDLGGSGSGAAFIVYGNTSVLCPDGELCSSMSLAMADATLIGERGDDFSGGAVTGGGDVDNDGVPDVVVGSRTEDSTDSDAGSASVMFGPLSGTVELSESLAKVLGLGAGDWTGAALSMGGDLNGDGFGDVLIGAPQLDAGADFPDIGAVFILKGGW
jgi:hypothetical protein